MAGSLKMMIDTNEIVASNLHECVRGEVQTDFGFVSGYGEVKGGNRLSYKISPMLWKRVLAYVV